MKFQNLHQHWSVRGQARRPPLLSICNFQAERGELRGGVWLKNWKTEKLSFTRFRGLEAMKNWKNLVLQYFVALRLWESNKKLENMLSLGT